jgi:pilus assembly protein TadC
MSVAQVNASWLLTESLRIGAIVLMGFLLAHLLGLFISAFGVELLYGVEDTLVAVIRYTTLITALLYAISRSVDEPTSPTSLSDD